jgi:glycosyltransferase involved in cell wall biosynthesis
MSTPASIVIVCHSYPPVIGGSELEAQRVCAALIRRGYTVKVVCAGGDPMPPLRDWIDPEGVPVRIYAGNWQGWMRDFVFGLRVAAMLLWERRNYQIVYFLMQGFHLAVGLPAARFAGKPILVKIGGSGVIPIMTRSAAGRLELRWLRRWASRIMILNDGMKEEALREGFPAEQLYWMPNPVDTEKFVPCDQAARLERRARFGIPATAPVALYCGRLAPEKALPSLIDAFEIVVRRIPDAVLVLVGDGPLRAPLTEQAARLQIPEKNLRFAGRVAPEDVPTWLQIADVFTLVSPSEGFPCALAEAMSAGLASVVSDIPGNRQLIESGKHGLLVPVGDSEAIAQAIAQIFEDNPMRTRMSHESRARVVENYATAKIADRYETLFQESLAP